MRTPARIMIGLFAAATLTACGGGVTESELREEFESMGYPDRLANCVVDEIKKSSGGIDAFGDLEESEAHRAASEAGAACAQGASPEELTAIAKIMEKNGVTLKDSQVRQGVVAGMVKVGVAEDLANCVVDKAIDQNVTLVQLINDESKVQALAQACQ